MAQNTNIVGIPIILGIGGTGSAVVSNLYKRTEGIGKFIRFIIYDSDVASKPPYFPNNLFCYTVSRAEDAIKFCKDCMNLDKYPNFGADFRKYWPGMLTNSTDRTSGLGNFSLQGLGQSRPKGFLGFLRHIRETENVIQKVYQEYVQICTSQDVNIVSGEARIFIVASVAGGTGAGTFLDLAFYLKDYFKINNAICNVRGFFLLGVPAMKLRSKSLGDISSNWAKGNTYASIRELKWWEKSNRRFKKMYLENKEIDTEDKPYDSVFLFDLYNEVGQTLSSFQEYENLIADVIYDLLIRQISRTNISSYQDNFLQRGQFSLGSFGRSVLLYPKNDIVRLMGLWLLRHYIENIMIPEDEDKIREQIANDENTLRLVEDYKNKRSDIEYDLERVSIRIASRIESFPNNPIIDEKRIYKKMNKENYQDILSEIEKNNLKEYPQEIRTFLEKRYEIYLKDKKEAFYKNIRENVTKKGISFLHGYLSNFITSLETSTKINKNIYDLALYDSNESSTRVQNILTNLRQDKGGSHSDRGNLVHEIKKYHELIKKTLILDKKIKFYEDFKNFVEVLKKAVDHVHDIIKKELLKDIRTDCSSFESESKTLYTEYASTIKLLPIKDHLDDYKSSYKLFVSDSANKVNINDAQKSFEDEISNIIFNDIYQKIIAGENIDNAIKTQILIKIRDTSEKIFDSLFDNYIENNIFEVLFSEALKAGRKFEDFLKDNIQMLKKASGVFLEIEPQAVSANIAKQDFIFANRANLTQTIQKHSEIKANIPEFGINVDSNDLNEMIIVISCATGYDYNSLKTFKRPTGTYYIGYNDIIKHPIKDKRYESFIDARYNQIAIEKLFFLIAENFGIIKKEKKDKDEIYTYKGEALAREYMDREKTIEAFLYDIEREKKESIIRDINQEWRKKGQSSREELFNLIKRNLENIISELKNSPLKKPFEENLELINNAIFQKLFDEDDLEAIL